MWMAKLERAREECMRTLTCLSSAQEEAKKKIEQAIESASQHMKTRIESDREKVLEQAENKLRDMFSKRNNPMQGMLAQLQATLAADDDVEPVSHGRAAKRRALGR